MSTITKIVCDSCGANVQEAWHFGYSAFRFVIDSQMIDAAYGEAGACVECRALIENQELEALIAHAFAVTPAMRAAAPFVREFHRLVLANLTGAVRHVKLGDTSPPKDRFFEQPCPGCGWTLAFDRAEARDQAIVKTCPGCHAEVIAGPIGHKPDPCERREP